MAGERALELEILAQPDDVTCGPTSLHAVYRYYGDEIPLARVIEETRMLKEGGTLGALLGCHALDRGYRATLYSFNLRVFDPTWFSTPGVDLVEKIRARMRARDEDKLRVACRSYIDFLQRGGRVRFEVLKASLIRKFLKRGTPVLTGLSATFLYGCSREIGETNEYDDINGEPAGHFVVLHGYRPKERRVLVADPLRDNPRFEAQRYEAGIDRVMNAILVGVLTYDASLLILEPRRDVAPTGAPAKRNGTHRPALP